MHSKKVYFLLIKLSNIFIHKTLTSVTSERAMSIPAVCRSSESLTMCGDLIGSGLNLIPPAPKTEALPIFH